MTLPAAILGFITSTLLGAAVHLWVGGGAGRLLFLIILSWAGFWGGHFLSSLIKLSFFDLGPLHFGPGVAGSVIALAIGFWLSKTEAPTTEK